MKEFGSDFHFIPAQKCSGKVIGDYYPEAVFYADGRQALIDLFKQQGWKRLWVPEYFCYEVLSSMEHNGVCLSFYLDYPLEDESEVLLGLPFEVGDALLRVNYFGLRSRRTNQGIHVPVIEDHTHDLIGDWATNSDADWCIASLRKTLPLAEGGILWSPKGLKLQTLPKLTSENESLASKRWGAMRKKTLYLENEIDDKSEFRTDMVSTEAEFDVMSVSAIDVESSDYLKRFDIDHWYKQKQVNREILKETSSSSFAFTIVEPEDQGCNPFSMTLLFNNVTERNVFREYLINQSVYPAILWTIPESQSPNAKDFSERMLSIHCDGRYNSDEIMQLRDLIAGR